MKGSEPCPDCGMPGKALDVHVCEETPLREARVGVDPEDRLTLKVWETPLGYWAYGVYTGDGTKSGSLMALMACGGGMNDPESAVKEGLKNLERRIEIQACEHEWSPWLGVIDSKIEYCPKCKIVKGFSLGS